MINEIGSEFHWMQSDNGKGILSLTDCKDFIYVFSGRTAIETILRNLDRPKKALLPSYCCDSMIQPFRDQNISIEFYPVYYQDGLKIDLDIPDDVDILLWCNYFGFSKPMLSVESFVNRGGIIIEDITHSLFSVQPYNKQSHYLVASLRKWMPLLDGGLCVSRKKGFDIKPQNYPVSEYLSEKKTAMTLKTEYLEQPDESKKDIFLKKFSWCNAWLGKHYSNMLMDEESKAYVNSISVENQRKVRRQNADILYECLAKTESVKPLFPKVQMDCPLFVPVVAANIAERDRIRKYLVDNKVYCPVHWPHPNANCFSNLYDRELSLICDQRYIPDDMKRIGDLL